VGLQFELGQAQGKCDLTGCDSVVESVHPHIVAVAAKMALEKIKKVFADVRQGMMMDHP
jgi:hypothetical protein